MVLKPSVHLKHFQSKEFTCTYCTYTNHKKHELVHSRQDQTLKEELLSAKRHAQETSSSQGECSSGSVNYQDHNISMEKESMAKCTNISKYSCTFCKYKNKSELVVLTHEVIQHRSMIKQSCTSDLASQTHVGRFISWSSSLCDGKSKKNICKLCGTVCSGYQAKHLLSHVLNGPNDEVCKYCTFRGPKNMVKAHATRLHGEQTEKVKESFMKAKNIVTLNSKSRLEVRSLDTVVTEHPTKISGLDGIPVISSIRTEEEMDCLGETGVEAQPMQKTLRESGVEGEQMEESLDQIVVGMDCLGESSVEAEQMQVSLCESGVFALDTVVIKTEIEMDGLCESGVELERTEERSDGVAMITSIKIEAELDCLSEIGVLREQTKERSNDRGVEGEEMRETLDENGVGEEDSHIEMEEEMNYQEGETEIDDIDQEETCLSVVQSQPSVLAETSSQDSTISSPTVSTQPYPLTSTQRFTDTPTQPSSSITVAQSSSSPLSTQSPSPPLSTHLSSPPLCTQFPSPPLSSQYSSRPSPTQSSSPPPSPSQSSSTTFFIEHSHTPFTLPLLRLTTQSSTAVSLHSLPDQSQYSPVPSQPSPSPANLSPNISSPTSHDPSQHPDQSSPSPLALSSQYCPTPPPPSNPPISPQPSTSSSIPIDPSVPSHHSWSTEPTPISLSNAAIVPPPPTPPYIIQSPYIQIPNHPSAVLPNAYIYPHTNHPQTPYIYPQTSYSQPSYPHPQPEVMELWQRQNILNMYNLMKCAFCEFVCNDKSVMISHTLTHQDDPS